MGPANVKISMQSDGDSSQDKVCKKNPPPRYSVFGDNSGDKFSKSVQKNVDSLCILDEAEKVFFNDYLRLREGPREFVLKYPGSAHAQVFLAAKRLQFVAGQAGQVIQRVGQRLVDRLIGFFLVAVRAADRLRDNFVDNLERQ